jgi:hypothetical protein
VIADGPSTLRIKLKTESPGFMRLHAFAWGHKVRMMSKAAFDKHGRSGASATPSAPDPSGSSSGSPTTA